MVSGLIGAATLGVIVLGWGRGAGAYSSALSDVAVGVLFPAAGALVVQRQPRNAAGWVLVSAGLVSVSALSHQWVHHIHESGPGALPGRDVAVWLASWTFAPYWLQPTLLPLLFPDGTAPSLRWRRLGKAVVIVTIVGATAAAFRPDPDVEDLGFPNPLGLGPSSLLWLFVVPMFVAAIFSFFVAGPLCIASLVGRQRRAVGKTRAQLQWLMFGFVTWLVLLIPPAFLPLPRPADDWVFAAAFVAIPASIVIAVVRHGFLDVEIIVNRTIVYGGLTFVGLALYAVGVTSVGRWASERDAAPLVAAGAAFIAALARERIQRWVNRSLFGARSDPAAVVDRVGATLAGVAPAEALAALVGVVAHSLRLPYVAVEPVDPTGPVVAVGRPVAEVEELPVMAAGRHRAVLRVGHRHRGERFRPEEHVALADAARRAASVIQTASLAADLQHSRERLVVAREEERRRLRHDLHDGLGPALAGMALQVDGLGRRLRDDSELGRRATQLRDRLRETVSEVRRIVEGLRPAAVAELGLAEALRQMAIDDGEAPVVEVKVPEALPALPAAVEVAAFRIATEALANAIRHSGAAQCTIEANTREGWLVVEVSDDGSGFDADTAPGVGLRSMVERAAEVGGELHVDSRPGQGARVRARLPLEIA